MREITYYREGDYLLPDLLPPESPQIGVWGIRRLRFLKQHHGGVYTGLLLSGRLNAHLEETDRSANEVYSSIPHISRIGSSSACSASKASTSLYATAAP